MATIADDFNRADGPAGDNWLTQEGDAALWIAGNRAALNPVPGTQGIGVYSTPMTSDDVTISCTFAPVGTGGYLVLRARGALPFDSGVEAYLNSDVGWYLQAEAYEDAMAAASGVTYAVRLEIVGQTARLYVDDVLLLTSTGNTPTGNRYVSLAIEVAEGYIDDFSATDIGEGPDAATGFLNWSVGGHAGLSMSALGLRVNQWVHSVLGAFKWHAATVSPINHNTSVIKPIQWSHMAHDGITFVAAGINVLTISATGDSHGTD